MAASVSSEVFSFADYIGCIPENIDEIEGSLAGLDLESSRGAVYRDILNIIRSDLTEESLPDHVHQLALRTFAVRETSISKSEVVRMKALWSTLENCGVRVYGDVASFGDEEDIPWTIEAKKVAKIAASVLAGFGALFLEIANLAEDKISFETIPLLRVPRLMTENILLGKVRKLETEVAQGAFGKVSKVGLGTFGDFTLVSKVTPRMAKDSLKEAAYATMFASDNARPVSVQVEGDQLTTLTPDGGEDLFDLVVSSGIGGSKNIFRVVLQVAKQLAELARGGAVHTDVCLENIVVKFEKNDIPVATLIDYGSVKPAGPFHIKGIKRTFGMHAGYTALECFNEKKHFKPASDIWSLGCLLYVLIKKKPFLLSYIHKTARKELCVEVDEEALKILQEIRRLQALYVDGQEKMSLFIKEELESEFDAEMRGFAVDLLTRLLSLDRKSRPRAEEVVSSIEGFLERIECRKDEVSASASAAPFSPLTIAAESPKSDRSPRSAASPALSLSSPGGASLRELRNAIFDAERKGE